MSDIQNFANLAAAFTKTTSAGGATVNDRELKTLQAQLKDMTANDRTAAITALKQSNPSLQALLKGW